MCRSHLDRARECVSWIPRTKNDSCFCFSGDIGWSVQSAGRDLRRSQFRGGTHHLVHRGGGSEHRSHGAKPVSAFCCFLWYTSPMSFLLCITIGAAWIYARSIMSSFGFCDREKASTHDFIEIGKALHKMKGTTARSAHPCVCVCIYIFHANYFKILINFYLS